MAVGRSQGLCLCSHILLFTWFGSGPASEQINPLAESGDGCKPPIQMVTLLVRSFLTQRLPRSLPARRAQPPTATHRGAGDATARGTSQWHRGCRSPFPPFSRSLPSSSSPGTPAVLQPRLPHAAGCCRGARWPAPSVGSGVTGPCAWGQRGAPSRSPFRAFTGQDTDFFFFFSGPEELAFLPCVCKCLETA